MIAESPITFECAGERLVGILHAGAKSARTGVVIVVGGPQYRIGSHRQFVLMARAIAAAGFPVLRFDYRGMGDSEGYTRPFDDVDVDIEAAADCLLASVSSLEKIVLLGLCDAASANLIYAANDERIQGLVLINPWVRTQRGEAKAFVRYYYLQRLMQKTFWRKLFSGEFEMILSLRQFLKSLRDSRGSRVDSGDLSEGSSHSFIDRMRIGLSAFRRPILLLISERDLTAQEFVDLRNEDKVWNRCLARPEVITETLLGADHTMSSRGDLNVAADMITKWIRGSVDS